MALRPGQSQHITRYAWFLGNDLIDWASKKQQTISLSSTEGGYYAILSTIHDGLWIQSCLGELKVHYTRPTPLLGDNAGAISLTSNSSHHSRTKHIDIRHHFIHEHIREGKFSCAWIKMAENTTDILTKPLARLRHEYHCLGLGLVSH
jgi:hypothetical protein